MTSFPKAGKTIEIGHDLTNPAAPVSLSSLVNPQQGPGPQKVQRQINCLSQLPED
jgi:hypothetical protein